MTSRRADMLRVLTVVQEIELARLSKMASAYRAKVAELAALRARRTQQFEAAQNTDQLLPSAISGVDEKWRLWVDHQVQSVNAELARIAASKEAQFLKSRTALGRKRAMKSIIQKHRTRPGPRVANKM